MKIENVKIEKKINYPTINEINSKKIKKSIPNKWKKFGITSIVMELIIKTSAFASEEKLQTLSGDIEVQNTVNTVENLGGAVTVANPVSKLVSSSYMNHGIVIGTIAVFSISIVSLLIIKFKLNRNKDNKRIEILRNIFMILTVLSVSIFIAWQIIKAAI